MYKAPSMSQRTFFSDSLQESFDREGIVGVPLLDKEDIEFLHLLYSTTAPEMSDRKFHSTMFVDNADYRKQTSESIRQLIIDKINKVVSGYRMLFANFIVKEADTQTSVGIHQDWNFTSPEFLSINIWIPLVDINAQTGLFHALKASHHVFQNLRYTPYEEDRYRHLESFILRESSPYAVRAGEALIYDGAMIHFSDPNLSASQRVAIGAVMIPEGAPNRHYYKRDRNKDSVEVYEVDEAFYHGFDFFNEPKGVKKISDLDIYNRVPRLEDVKKIGS